MKSEVSCIIPVFNGARYIAEAIDSTLRQSRPPDEIIVIDDGSTDATPEVVKSFQRKVRYVQQNNKGVSAARNRGIELSNCDLLTFLDADDLFLEYKLEMQLSCLAKRPELEMIAGYTENFWSPDYNPSGGGHEFFRQAPWPRGLMTWLVRRSLFERIGMFDEQIRLSQDVDWHMRAVASGALIETLPQILSRRRMHATNNTRFANTACRASVLNSLRKHVLAHRVGQQDRAEG